jgi:hypothetical protein
MRILGLVLTLLVTLSMAAAALTYVQDYTGQNRIYFDGHRPSSPGHGPYSNSRYRRDTTPDIGRTVRGNLDPYLQRYYSQSEGWTYYTLPSYSSGRKSDDK